MVGLLIGKIDARKMVAFGLIGGAFTLIWLGQLNLNAGYWDIFWPQFFQGLALSALFVPLTTISMPGRGSPSGPVRLKRPDS